MKSLKKSLFGIAQFLCLIVFSSHCFAEQSYSNINESFRNATGLIKYEMYADAILYLKKADQETPNNADINNMLGFSHRKLQRYSKALSYYKKALKLDPKHKAANEYLGELYVETGQIDKAKQQLAKLDKLCIFKCKEYKKLKKVIKKYEKKHRGS